MARKKAHLNFPFAEFRALSNLGPQLLGCIGRCEAIDHRDPVVANDRPPRMSVLLFRRH
jgi:hypothetical protein